MNEVGVVTLALPPPLQRSRDQLCCLRSLPVEWVVERQLLPQCAETQLPSVWEWEKGGAEFLL